MAKGRTMPLTLSGQLNITAKLAAIFGVWFVALYALTAIVPEAVFDPLNRHTADMAARILGLCGFHPVLADTLLSQDGFAVSVVTECSVLYMGMLYVSFVAAYPSALGQKFIGLAAGFPLLHLGNILRVALVFAVGVKERGLFEFVHVYLGQVLMVLFVIAVCLVWVRWLLPGPGKFKPAAFIARVIAFSSIPFLLWLVYNNAYVHLTDHLVYWLFSLFHVQLGFNYQHEIYYQTFNMVTFTGLMLASRFRTVKRKFLALAAGILIIVAAHLLFRICNGLMITFGMQSAYILSLAVSIIGQYLLPIVLWLAMVLREDEPEDKLKKKMKKPYLHYRWPYLAEGER